MAQGLSWGALFLNGSIVDLNVSQWAARLKLRPSDLGIEDTKEVGAALALGATRLAPGDAFQAIDGAVQEAKRAVENHSLAFGFIRGARYVPEAKLADLLRDLAAIQAKHEAAVAAFLEGFAAMRGEQLPIIETALAEAAKTPEAAEEAIARIRSEYPEAGEVAKKFGLTWTVYGVAGARTQTAQDAIAAEGETVRGVVAEMVGGLRDEVAGKIGDVLALIEKGGKLQPRSIESALAVLDRVEAVNVLGDADLANQIRRLRASLKAIDAGKRIPDAQVAGLAEIRSALADNIAEAVAAAEASLTGVGKRRLQIEVGGKTTSAGA